MKLRRPNWLKRCPKKPRSIRDILYRRLSIYLSVGLMVGTVLVGVAAAQYFNEGRRGRIIHFAELVLLAIREVSERPDVLSTRNDNILSKYVDDISVTDYFVVVIRNGEVVYTTLDLPTPVLFDLPLEGEFSLEREGVIFGNKIDWELYGIADEELNARIIIGVWQGEAILGTLTVTGLVFAIGLIIGTITLMLVRRLVRQVVQPLEDSAAAVMQRGENEMMPIHLDSGLNELIQIEDALNDLIARLDRTVRRERNFIANAAHELRTPLAAVRAQAEAIDMQGISPQVSGQINGVLEATDRATRLISQLLQLARSESATPVNADGNSIDLVAIARDLISQITPEIFEVRGDIELIAPASARVPGNAELIHAMLRNLLENAVKYAGKPIRISVTVEAGGEDGPSICVEDNGPGLSELDFQAALVKFERLGRKSGGGAGLGLSIVQEIVERLNLRIAMASAGRLGGLKVTVLFHRIASP